MPEKKSNPEKFEDLNWQNLYDNFDTATVSRGRDYQKYGNVTRLIKTEDGNLAAYVDGSKRYATTIFIQGNKIISYCSCPVGYKCKHAVAAILEYLNAVKMKKEVTEKSPYDSELHKIYEVSGAAKEAPELKSSRNTAEHSAEMPKASSKETEELIRDYLNGLQKEELIRMIMELCLSDIKIEKRILEERHFEKSEISPVYEEIISDINTFTEYDGYDHDYYDDEEDLPDFTSVEERMNKLLLTGHIDEVIEIGKILSEKANPWLDSGCCDEDGLTGYDIEGCMDVFYEALAKSTMDTQKRMLIALKAETEDMFGLCNGRARFWDSPIPQKEWSDFADRLLIIKKKGVIDISGEQVHFDPDSTVLDDEIINALDKGWRKEEANEYLIANIEKKDYYRRLILRLFEDGENDEAKKWAYKGIHNTEQKGSAIARYDIIEILRELFREEGNNNAVSLAYAVQFLISPSPTSYSNLIKSSENTKFKDTARDLAKNYLTTGDITGLKAMSMAEEKLYGHAYYGIKRMRDERRRRNYFPDYITLIKIAINEDDKNEILRWYEEYSKDKGYISVEIMEKTADAVSDEYPDISINLWLSRAESLIAEVNPKSYEKAVKFLNKIRILMIEKDDEKGWKELNEMIRKENSRKRRLIEKMDMLDGKRIID